MLSTARSRESSHLGFPSGSVVKKKKEKKKYLPANVENIGDAGSIPGWVINSEGRHGHPLQYPCLENSIDGGIWWATVHWVAKSWPQLSMHTLIWAGFVSMAAAQ